VQQLPQAKPQQQPVQQQQAAPKPEEKK